MWTLTYGTANLGSCSAIDECEASNGKLVTATRHNLDPLFGDVPVTETYKYYGRGGRLAERTTDVGSAGGLQGASFVTRRDWNELGLVGTVAYPTTAAAGQDRFVGYAYDQGILTGVNGYGTVTYQPSGLLAAVAHANGVSETWDPDPQGMARPARIRATSGGQTLWDSGSYAYDGAGNITTIGAHKYRYDQVGRLTYESNPYPEAFYSYDAFGNRTASTIARVNGDVFGRVTTTVDVDPHTNRLQGTALYDDAGNLTQWAVDDLFTYDPLSMVTTHNAAGRVVHMLYTADDERIAQVQRLPGTDGQLHNKTTWTLRAPDNQLLRVFTDDATSGSRVWSWTEDEIWRGASLMANESPVGTRHYAVDHLGSPRLVTSAAGALLGTEEFSAFGEGGTTGAGALEFTGHERDWSHGPIGWAETFDYMHARYYAPTMGRFLSVDPVLDSKRAIAAPQMWNRYGYVSNNPVSRADANGQAENDFRCVECRTQEEREGFQRGVNQAMRYGLPIVAATIVIAMAPEILPAISPGMFQFGIRALPVLNILRNLGAAETGAPSYELGGFSAAESAVAKAESTAAKFDMSADALVSTTLKEGGRFVDRTHGTINVFMRRPDGKAGFVRVTIDAAGKVISVGLNRARDVQNGLKTGRFIPITR